MGITLMSSAVYTCDGCGAIRYSLPSERAAGYDGSVLRSIPGDPPVQAYWWAHTKRCIGNAARNALANELARVEAGKPPAHAAEPFIDAEPPEPPI